jgi:hypothetical protein
MENKVIIKIMLWATICLPIASAFGQGSTYVKSFRLYDQGLNETGQSLLNHQNTIYINSGAVCNSRSCAFYARIGDDGKVRWRRGHLWTDDANDNSFAINKDTLYIGSHSNTIEPIYHLIKINASTGDSIRHFSYDLTASSPTGVAVNGILLHKNDILMYGEAVRTGPNSGKSKGIIQWVNLGGVAFKQKLYPVASDNQNGVDRVENLQPDSTGNLVYITQTAKNFVEYSVIRKVNQDGEIIRELQIEAGSNQFSHLPIMTVDTKGNYILEHRIKISLVPHVQLICVDTLGNKVWDFTRIDYSAGPDNPDQYNYSKIKGTSDGGVIAVGLVKAFTDPDEYFEDAYVLKLDNNGKKEWERRINFVDDNDTLLDRCGFLDVVQTEDGGYAALGYHRYSHSLGLKESLLVRMDKNGCVIGHDCSVDTMIVRSSLVDVNDTNYLLSKMNLYPNPFYDHLTISDVSPAIKQVFISDVMGNVAYRKNIDVAMDHFQIDGVSWPPGLYIVSGRDMFGNVVDRKKIIKY